MEFGPILRAIRRNKVRYGLIVAEVALTLAVVANCVHMIREARREMAIPSGFDDANLIRVTSTPFAEAFKEQGYRDNQRELDLAGPARDSGRRSRLRTRGSSRGRGAAARWRPGRSDRRARCSATRSTPWTRPRSRRWERRSSRGATSPGSRSARTRSACARSSRRTVPPGPTAGRRRSSRRT